VAAGRSILMKTLCLFICFLAFALPPLAAEGPDLYERYLEAVGTRQLHDELVFAGFRAAATQFEAQGRLPRDPAEKEVLMARAKKVFAEEVGYDTMKSHYRAEAEKRFSREELEAVILDLEKPAVAAILRKQAESVAEIMGVITARIPPENAARAQRRLQQIFRP
jgi:hypothetical protein